MYAKIVDPALLKSFLSGVAVGLVGFIVAIVGPLQFTNALSVDSSRDCDNNAVVKCGALTTRELHHKYNQTQDVQALYSQFGISNGDIGTLTNKAVAGKVTEGGRVIVDNETVATDAMTAGRMDMSGSTAVTASGTTFYKRTPSVSFASSSLPAYVVMKDGQFDYAIIASCGNPVTATPVAKPTPAPGQPAPQATPTPTPLPAAPTATPASSSSSSSSSAASSSTAVANVTVNQPQPQAQPQPAPVVAAPVVVQPVKTLPKTGIDDALYLTILSGIGGTVAHLLYTRRKYKLSPM